MDIIWPYINSKDQEELQYSLLLAAKNLHHRKLLVVGDKPQFLLSDNYVTHMRPSILRWSMLSPLHDVINKLNFIVQQDISDDFIFMNDDIFVMKPTEIKPHHRGTLDEHIDSRPRNDSYTKNLNKTNEYLKSLGIEKPLSYELHIPMIFNKQKLHDLLEDLIPRIQRASPMNIRSLYGNIYEVGGSKIKDVKNISNYKGKTFLSTNENTFDDELGEYIRGQV